MDRRSSLVKSNKYPYIFHKQKDNLTLSVMKLKVDGALARVKADESGSPQLEKKAKSAQAAATIEGNKWLLSLYEKAVDPQP